jgi:hypothetical protein
MMITLYCKVNKHAVNMITQAADRIMDIAEMNIKTEGQGQCT